MGVKKAILRLITDDRGQSTTEYILILSVVVMVALKFKTTFQKRLGTMLDTLGGKIDGAMRDDGTSSN